MVTMASSWASAEISDVQLKSARVITDLANNKEFDFVKFYVDGVAASIRSLPCLATKSTHRY
jgi:hypothetical protein